jgi:hypothetical protein
MGTFTEGREMKLKKTAPGIYQVSDQESAKECAKLETGMFVEVKKAKKSRSTREHRLIFALAKKTLENLDQGHTNDIDFIKTTMLCLGYSKKYKMNGKIYEVPLSINFANMEHELFHKMSKELIEAWSALLGCSPEDLTGSVGDIE